MIRPSSLSLAERCELAPLLSAEFPETNAGTERGNLVDGQVSRRLLGGAPATDPDAIAVLDWLHANGMHGAQSWNHVQEEIALVDPDSGELLTRGTADIANHDGRQRLLTVLDMKKREQYAAGRLKDPDENLQLHAYALAWTYALGAKAYRLAFLLFGGGAVEPIWSAKCYTENGGGETASWLPHLDRIREIERKRQARAAKGEAQGRPLPTSGEHCAQCYPRLHCPSWMFPKPVEGAPAGELAQLTSPALITSDNAGPLLMYAMALEEQAKRAKEILREWALNNGGQIDIGDRKWSRVIVDGRKSGPSVDELESMGLGHLVKHGKPFEQWRIGKR